MIYGSVCSGIEAASVAWEPLGFAPAWFSEIEPFPSAVLAHHWPKVANLGDMTKIADSILTGEIDAPDILVGGTPCQAFSVAGARKGLADDRGFLTIKYVELADAIDQSRTAVGDAPCITVWENVPGVLSSKDNAFGAFLGLLAGEDCELQPPGRKWENAGYVRGPKRAIAWRILDAQYFGVAQRRRRVFVVSSARTDFDPAKVLFECEGMRRDSAPSREAGSVVAALTANGVGTCGADDNQGQVGHLIPAVDVCPTLRAGGNATGGDRPPGTDVDTAESLQVVMTVHGTQDPDTNLELAHTLGRNQGQENAVFAQCVTGDITHTLKAEGFDASEDGTGRGQQIVPVAFQPGNLTRGAGASPSTEVFPTLKADHGRGASDQDPHVAYPLLEVGKRTGTSTTDPRAGLGVGANGDPMFTLQAGAQHGVAAFAENSRQEVRLEGGDGQITGALSGGGGKVGQGYPAVVAGMAVRRLIPVECERLQGFPDGHTAVPFRNKPASDGPRYKAIGNSMAVPVMRWIGERIKLHLEDL